MRILWTMQSLNESPFYFRKSQVALCQFNDQADSINGEKVKKTISKMQPLQVLLMLIQHGANGLNLLEAQHVLLEPLLNPSAE